MWKRKAAQQAATYRAEAERIRQDLQVESLRTEWEDRQRRADIAGAAVRASLDDERVREQVARLKAARERNHFTERMRAILAGERMAS